MPEEHLAFTYNRDFQDGFGGCTCGNYDTHCEEIPIWGVKYLSGYRNTPSEPVVLSSFMPINNLGLDPTLVEATGDPFYAEEFYNYMQGKWKDGTSLTQGGDGYDPNGTPTNFAFPNNPSNPEGWSMCTADLPNGDRRYIMIFGPLSFNPNDNIHLDFAVLWVPDVPHPCPDVSPLIEAGQIAQNWFDATVTSTQSIEKQASIQLFPNPMQEAVQISLIDQTEEIESFHLFDARGKLSRQYENLSTNELRIQRKELAAGVYFYSLKTTDGQLASGKIIIQ